MAIESLEILWLLLAGLLAGIIGGLTGIGGSIIMIPAMAFLFHRRSWDNQHLYQGAAMIVNLAVALPALIQHKRAGALPRRFIQFMLPATVLTIVAGVLLSNQLETLTLRRAFAAFLVYVVVLNIREVLRRQREEAELVPAVTPVRASLVGALMGSLAGLLGIGGGVIAVPAAQVFCRLPLRQCIAASAAVMCVTSPIGAAVKLFSLPRLGSKPEEAVVLALALAPTAVLGGFIGAGLTHKLPIVPIRLALCAVLILAAIRLSGLL